MKEKIFNFIYYAMLAFTIVFITFSVAWIFGVFENNSTELIDRTEAMQHEIDKMQNDLDTALKQHKIAVDHFNRILDEIQFDIWGR